MFSLNSKMKVVLQTLFALTALFVCSRANDQYVTREYVWHYYKDFLDYGWAETYPGMTQTFSTPSELDTKLYELNKNFTGEVWGWKPPNVNGSNKHETRYTLDLSRKPEYCGIVNATVWFRHYLESKATPSTTYLHPACGRVCNIDNSKFATWSWFSQPLVLTDPRFHRGIELRVHLQHVGIFLMDEVRLVYTVKQGIDCPYSCNHDCEYRPVDCHNYYTCVDYRYKEFRTCNRSEGLAFNPEIKSCDFIQNVEACNKPRGPPAKPHCVCEYRPHERYCNWYYYCPNICHLEQCQSRKCPTGLLWSTDAKGDGSGNQQCMPPEKAFCSTNETAESTTPFSWRNRIEASLPDTTTTTQLPK